MTVLISYHRIGIGLSRSIAALVLLTSTPLAPPRSGSIGIDGHSSAVLVDLDSDAECFALPSILALSPILEIACGCKDPSHESRSRDVSCAALRVRTTESNLHVASTTDFLVGRRSSAGERSASRVGLCALVRLSWRSSRCRVTGVRERFALQLERAAFWTTTR